MWTVLVRPERCIGCRQCEFACAVAHSQSKDAASAIHETPLPRSRIHVQAGPAINSAFPNRCRHCSPAPCVEVCPTGAMHRESAHELVLTDAGKCIFCAMCAMVCPFDAVGFHDSAVGMPARVTATKCDGCVERLEGGLVPACVEACKTGALVFGELNELIATDRARQSARVLASMTAPETGTPASVAAWRAWGASTRQVNKEVGHGQP